MSYDYKEGKNRVDKILKNSLEVLEKKQLPLTEKLTFNNSYYSWVTSIYIDIRESTNLFKNENNVHVSKIIKSFTSELIEILRDSEKLREIGIVGDCVYAIYTAPNKQDNEDLYFKACYCNTYIKMLNKLLNKNELPTFKAGIGLGDSEVLVIKSGRKNVGINKTAWIGNSIVDASNFSSIANKGKFESMVMSHTFYNNLYDIRNKIENLFTKEKHDKYGYCYTGNVVMTKFNEWIENGFKD